MRSVIAKKRRKKRVKQIVFRVLSSVVILFVLRAVVLGLGIWLTKGERAAGEVVFTGTIGKVEKGKIPLLLQSDKRWAGASYGGGTIKKNGCAPTALAMVAAGLTGDNQINPYRLAVFAEENGYYADGVGTSWSLMTEGCRSFGVEGTEISLSKEVVLDTLRSKKPVICSVGPGDFTTEGHFIVLTGVKDGKIRVHDPNSKKNSRKLWDYERLEGQIKNLWSFTAL